MTLVLLRISCPLSSWLIIKDKQFDSLEDGEIENARHEMETIDEVLNFLN